MLGICERLVQDPAAYDNPLFISVRGHSGELLLAAVMTPPHNLILAEGVDFGLGLPSLIEHLRENKIGIPGVIGSVDCAEAFYEHWKSVTGLEGEVGMYQRIYELRQVNLPKIPPGHSRVAWPEDAQRIAGWIQAFENEALGKEEPLKPDWAERVIHEGKMFLWVDEGQPVAMAMKTRPLKHSITVSAVYTPPEHRQRGYATALVARLSQHLLDMGYEFINLFTDLENPTSNSIYQKIGYRPVIDFRSYRFKQN
ncbi:GNAT family N-acetyltransferase [Chloroflexota bacterium]|nr:GNAT family N-acetyltransferase [Chloroflexota bacterium]